MKAIQHERFGDASVLKLADLPRPVPDADQVLIEVAAAGVSYVDVRQRQGIYNKSETRVGGVVLPNVPGLQAVGRVVEVGAEADAKLLGRKVLASVGKGAYADLLAAPSALCVPVSDEVDEGTLSVLPMQGLTAYFMLTVSTRLRAGESILVHAAGSGVGALAVQLAKIMGAGRIIASASSEEKRAYARSIGADVTVDYTADSWTQEVLDATDRRGVDVILESIGGEVFEQNFTCLAVFGRYILFGSTRGLGEPVAARRLMTKCQSLTGIYVPVFHSRPDLIREGMGFMADLVAKGDLKLQIGAELPFAEAAQAHRLLENRKVTGGIVLRP